MLTWKWTTNHAIAASLVLARLSLRQSAGPPSSEEFAQYRQEAEGLSQPPYFEPLYLARLWLALGDIENAKQNALHNYRWAWGKASHM